MGLLAPLVAGQFGELLSYRSRERGRTNPAVEMLKKSLQVFHAIVRQKRTPACGMKSGWMTDLKLPGK